MIIKIAFTILCLVPFLNFVLFILTCIFANVYRSSLAIHDANLSKVKDPFKRMTFDPEVCFNMGCDYYFLTIELKCTLLLTSELQGILINYQENVSDRLKLRKERGKTNVMIYNANFWASYNYYQKWKVYHYSPLAFSLTTLIIINVVFIVFILA